jgi:hypothetical protein
VEYFFLEELGQAQTLQNANGGKKTREWVRYHQQ